MARRKKSEIEKENVELKNEIQEVKPETPDDNVTPEDNEADKTPETSEQELPILKPKYYGLIWKGNILRQDTLTQEIVDDLRKNHKLGDKLFV